MTYQHIVKINVTLRSAIELPYSTIGDKTRLCDPKQKILIDDKTEGFDAHFNTFLATKIYFKIFTLKNSYKFSTFIDSQRTNPKFI